MFTPVSIDPDMPEDDKVVFFKKELVDLPEGEDVYEVIARYYRTLDEVRPNTKSLLVPHFEDYKYYLRNSKWNNKLHLANATRKHNTLSDFLGEINLSLIHI